LTGTFGTRSIFLPWDATHRVLPSEGTTMSTNVIVFGWERSVPGRESASAQHFRDFTQYLQACMGDGSVESFEPFLLEPRGGTLNGFFLIRGTAEQLSKLQNSEQWIRHQVRATLHLVSTAIMRGVGGEAVPQRMALWMESVPK
jgi:hypothetical protein